MAFQMWLLHVNRSLCVHAHENSYFARFVLLFVNICIRAEPYFILQSVTAASPTLGEYCGFLGTEVHSSLLYVCFHYLLAFNTL